MVGNSGDARRAIEGHLPYLSEGAFRTAYIDFESSVVYKVENHDGAKENNNRTEWDNYNSIDRALLPKGWKIPAMSLFDVDGVSVIAVEFVAGTVMGECYCYEYLEPDHDTACVPDEVCMAVWKAGIMDLGYGNVVRTKTSFYVVDLGC